MFLTLSCVDPTWAIGGCGPSGVEMCQGWWDITETWDSHVSDQFDWLDQLSNALGAIQFQASE